MNKKKAIIFPLVASVLLALFVGLPQLVSAETFEFINPINANTATQLLNNILNALRSVIVVIAIIFIIIGGLFYMTSAGDEKKIEKAKSIITGAIIGLAIVIAAPAFLKQIIETFGGSTDDPEVSKALSIQQIAMNVLQFLLSITGIIAIISLVVGGAFYMTAYGDEDRIDKGKKIITYSIVGITVALLSLVIVRQLAGILGGA